MTGIKASARAYEDWIRARLGDAFVAEDLVDKHKKMRESAFLFLRATCWRWAETAPAICSGLIGAPGIASVGDAHVGNFGLWRDAEGRLVWGINDYDEAAVTPWPLDLVRLATSALLAEEGLSAREAATAILKGYGEGLERPGPFVLEGDHLWLRDLFAADDKKRSSEWKKLLSAKRVKNAPPERFVAALAAAMPEPELKTRLAPRVAGAGSLGRMRIVASIEDYRGGPLAREAKAVVPSCWDRKAAPGAFYRLASGRHRSPDPWLEGVGDVVVRRLSPNSRKIDLAEHPRHGLLKLLEAMARDIASVHAADRQRAAAVREDFARRKQSWLRHGARAAAEAAIRDRKAWRSK